MKTHRHRTMLLLLDHLANYPCTNQQNLAHELHISRPTVTRLLQHAREHFGVQLQWQAKQRRYCISDWGVFEPKRLRRYVRRF